jgi:hypothetical protein
MEYALPASVERQQADPHRKRSKTTTSREDDEVLLAGAILKILEAQVGEAFTAADLTKELVTVLPSISNKTATQQRAAISYAVKRLRREGHPIPPYKYQLLR